MAVTALLFIVLPLCWPSWREKRDERAKRELAAARAGRRVGDTTVPPAMITTTTKIYQLFRINRFAHTKKKEDNGSGKDGAGCDVLTVDEQPQSPPPYSEVSA
jgi:hypothetical protein